jgi:archaellum component FlaC
VVDGAWHVGLRGSTVLAMATDTELRRRVTRLENETESIYELITGIQSTLDDHSQRFDTIDQRFDTIDQRFDTIDQRFDTIHQGFDTIDQRFDTMDERFGSIETTLAEVVRRLPEPP